MNKTTDLQITRITNLTNGIDLHKSKQNEIMEITEYGAEVITIVLPKPAGKNLLVNIDATLLLNGKKNPFIISGKIIKVEPTLDKTYTIEIELHDFDRVLWNDFLKLRQEAQNQVDDVFRKIKGDE